MTADKTWEFKLHLRIPIQRLESEPLEVARTFARSVALLEENLGKAVQSARAKGHSWSEIGEALETTKQSAWQRFASPED